MRQKRVTQRPTWNKITLRLWMRRRSTLLLSHQGLSLPTKKPWPNRLLVRRSQSGSSSLYGSTHTGSCQPCSGRSSTILIMLLFQLFRKLFTFVFTSNAVGLGLAASGHFPYAVQRTGAMALGNLSCAILMRNELFGRFLYLLVTTCFAKVTTQIFQRLS
jgi:hypothetical protein